ncbi:non-hydrolyzing UDP-N-acetylglucosamine 2-epimerase [Serinicoccus sediminis]|uniref:non-hydrolyzing UDP-N-acetylglucosamine 2-epimerase n=1 Tax=Serinicoccus sediminis TaxID=2306021 RepID=UPI00101F83DE|nr:UDP-N-acetylglucosamine 2-epimerase (non-hydrolyzing) [Serinicoccus sediminis]
MTHRPLVLHVTGARPNFPKAAPVIEALGAHEVEQLLVHTGQHYDDRMSQVFFSELGLPRPDVDLGIGSGTHAGQTAAAMVGLEEVMLERRPALVVVYGDVNSTVAAALVAAKLHIPVAHVEAGLRSFDRTMPEEVNRVVTDRISDLLLVTCADAADHLRAEGADPATVHLVGNPMIDTLLRHRGRLDEGRARSEVGLPGAGDYVLATLHRPGNVDDREHARRAVATLHQVADHCPVVLPMHPRSRPRLLDVGLLDHPGIRPSDPLGYLGFLSLVQGASVVVTDSGGVQEETTVLGVPCLTLRPSTERPVTITHGTNALTTHAELPGAVAARLAAGRPAPGSTPVPPLWDGHAGPRIAAVLAGALRAA